MMTIWSNKNEFFFIYEAYYNYRLNGGNSYYIKAIVENTKVNMKDNKTRKISRQYNMMLCLI